MKIGFDGRTYSDAEYSRILKASSAIFKKIYNGKPLTTCAISYVKEYRSLSRHSRAESLVVLCKKYKIIKFKVKDDNGWTGCAYSHSFDSVNEIRSSLRVISELPVESVCEQMISALKQKKEINITSMCAMVHGFKMLSTMERMNFIASLESSGLIKIRREKIRRMESTIMSLPDEQNRSNEMSVKSKSDELIEQANKLLAAAEEAKKEEERQLSRNEVLNIHREINVEIIEMEKQIDGIIDSFSKLKNLFDKLK